MKASALPTRRPIRLRLPNPVRLHERALRQIFKLAKLQPMSFQLRSGTMHAWVARSEKRPLIMLPGFGADALHQWYPQVRALGRERQLVLPDFYFFGDSHSWSDDRSIELQMEAIVDLVDQLGLEHFDLMGLSYGGLVGLLLAARYPERVGKLIMVGSPGPAMDGDDLRALLRRWDVDCLSELLLPGDAAGVKRLLQVAHHRPKRLPKFLLRKTHEHLFVRNVDEKRRLLASIVATIEGERPEADPPTCETLLVWGEQDRIFPLELGERLREMLECRMAIIPNVAHAPNMDAPRAFNRIVREFLT